MHARLNSITVSVNSFQDKNASAICDLRSSTNTFLTELISVVGQQFEKLQANLKQSHAENVKVHRHFVMSSGAVSLLARLSCCVSHELVSLGP